MSSASELPVVPGHFRQGYIVYTAFVVPSCEESKDLKRDYAKHEQLTPQNFKISRFSPQQNSRVEALRLANQVKPELKTQSAAKFKPHGSRLSNPQDLTGTVSPPDIKTRQAARATLLDRTAQADTEGVATRSRRSATSST
ncbi:hypothetical protein B0H14DRAFT_2564747 [Mycena olivaceomarginata]|nr:hypothetical protein B0H14DRAFT_2564747 [Mycena olivaceomarginata]